MERLEIIDTGRRRRFTTAMKLQIVAESYSEPGFCATTARRHGLSRSQLYEWRRLAREGKLGGSFDGFVPALVVSEIAPNREGVALEAPPAPVSSDAIVVELTGSGRIRICASAPPLLVSAVLKALR